MTTYGIATEQNGSRAIYETYHDTAGISFFARAQVAPGSRWRMESCNHHHKHISETISRTHWELILSKADVYATLSFFFEKYRPNCISPGGAGSLIARSQDPQDVVVVTYLIDSP